MTLSNMPPFEIIDKIWDIGRMKRFAICVDNDDYPVSLELHKLYRILPDDDAAIDGDVRIVDESSEDYLYPAANFVVVESPKSAEQAVESSFTLTPQMRYAADRGASHKPSFFEQPGLSTRRFDVERT
jgi:hypothetical protein